MGENPAGGIGREEVFLEYTKSICPVCKAVIDASVDIRESLARVAQQGLVHLEDRFSIELPQRFADTLCV